MAIHSLSTIVPTLAS
jgi:hypothetical protein